MGLRIDSGMRLKGSEEGWDTVSMGCSGLPFLENEMLNWLSCRVLLLGRGAALLNLKGTFVLLSKLSPKAQKLF